MKNAPNRLKAELQTGQCPDAPDAARPVHVQVVVLARLIIIGGQTNTSEKI